MPALYNDLWRFDPATSNWTLLSSAAVSLAPPPRNAMGFAITPDGAMYLFGGTGQANNAWGELS